MAILDYHPIDALIHLVDFWKRKYPKRGTSFAIAMASSNCYTIIPLPEMEGLMGIYTGTLMGI